MRAKCNHTHGHKHKCAHVHMYMNTHTLFHTQTETHSLSDTWVYACACAHIHTRELLCTSSQLRMWWHKTSKLKSVAVDVLMLWKSPNAVNHDLMYCSVGYLGHSQDSFLLCCMEIVSEKHTTVSVTIGYSGLSKLICPTDAALIQRWQHSKQCKGCRYVYFTPALTRQGWSRLPLLCSCTKVHCPLIT